MGGSSSNSVPSSVDMVASQKNADLVNKQWADYQTRFQPQEAKLINDVNGNGGLQTTLLPQSLAQASADNSNVFNSEKSQQDRDLSRYGQGMNAEQQQQQGTQLGIAQSAGAANANNTTIQADQDMKNTVMSGGLGAASGAV